MESSTVHAAAQTTGWSVRMLHYLDAAGLVSPPRSAGGYRLYGEREIAHLRGLRQLLADHDLKPADLQVALRLRSEPALRHAVDDWLGATVPGAAQPTVEPDLQPQPGSARSQAMAADASTSWLRFEQDKHSRALHSDRTPLKENA